MSERSPILLVDAVTRNPVDAVLVDSVSDDALRAADQAWVSIRYQAAIDATRRGEQHAPHTHWHWQNKAGPARNSRRILGVECNDEMQALIALCLDRNCRLPEQVGQPLVYVDYIETAPWNLKRYTEQPRFRGCGPHLIRAAVGLSLSRGWEGRLGLHALEEDDTLRFYRQVCGMTEMPPDASYYSLRYFEMTVAQAKAFQEKGGERT